MGRTEGPDSNTFPSRPSSNRDNKRNHNHGFRSSQSRTVIISKALSRLLRHQAQNEGVPITSDGWVRLDHLLAWRGLKDRNGVMTDPTVDEIWMAVEENNKKRFAVRWTDMKTMGDGDENTAAAITTTTTTTPATTITTATNADTTATKSTPTNEPQSESQSESAAETETHIAIKTWRAGTDKTPSHYLIRATQGHSIKTVTSTSELMRPITLDDPASIPTTCVHGTFYGAWARILASGGLRAMGRNHVHFATGPALVEVLPHKSGSKDTSIGVGDGDGDAIVAENAGEKAAKVISGMRHDAQILIYVDLKRCLEDVSDKGVEMQWWRSENGVVLTAGVDSGAVAEGGDVTSANADVAVVADAVNRQGMQDKGAKEGEQDALESTSSSLQPTTMNAEKHVEVEGKGKERGNWKQKKHQHQHQHMHERAAATDGKMVPMKYWSVVVEAKHGLGVLWRQGEGVVQELPPKLAAQGTPKSSRGGGRGGRRGR